VTPQWYEDAKFGIYFHWGIYSVPAFGSEWYSRNMYQTNQAAYRHHLEAFGSLDKFGYKDFIPKFTAEKFNAEEWVDLFAGAGAR
jgi:alpha-L-fucosidase